MSLIIDAMRTAQREKQRRESGGGHAGGTPVPVLVPLRTPSNGFSWQRSVALGVGGALTLASGWLVFQRLRNEASGQVAAVSVPAANLAGSVAADPAGSTTAVPPPRAAPRTGSPTQTVARPLAGGPRRPQGQRVAAAPAAAADTSPVVLQGGQGSDTVVVAGSEVAALVQAAVREEQAPGRLRISVDRPRDFDAARLFALGVAAHRAGDTSAARGAYERVLALSPNDVDALNNLGILLAEQRELDRAEFVLRRAVVLDSRNAGVWSNLAGVLREREKPAEAIVAFQQALAIDPRHQGARVGLAQQHLALGSPAQARELLEDVLRLNPAAAEAHYALGQVLELQGDRAAAIRAYSTFIRLAPAKLASHVEQVRRRVEALGARAP